MVAGENQGEEERVLPGAVSTDLIGRHLQGNIERANKCKLSNQETEKKPKTTQKKRN